MPTVDRFSLMRLQLAFLLDTIINREALEEEDEEDETLLHHQRGLVTK